MCDLEVVGHPEAGIFEEDARSVDEGYLRIVQDADGFKVKIGERFRQEVSPTRKKMVRQIFDALDKIGAWNLMVGRERRTSSHRY